MAHVLLTRLPLRLAGEVDAGRVRRAAVAFPLVGIAVGGAAALARVAADPLGSEFASLVAVAAAVVVTGALHEDGLADTADALGARDRARRLEIMRDSRLGTYGALALVVVLLARVALLARFGVGEAALALLAAHVLARWSVLPQAALVRPARPDGSGATLAGLPLATLAAGSALALALGAPLLLAVEPAGLVALAVAPVVAGGCALAWRRAFGGVTGDTHGATVQLVELATYVCVAAASV